ncbi:MAG: hypothetical protein AAF617_06930 [Bacteroidota bacterium]
MNPIYGALIANPDYFHVALFYGIHFDEPHSSYDNLPIIFHHLGLKKSVIVTIDD